MAVAPDILLSPTPAPSPRTTPSKAAQDSVGTSNDKGSSFADVYAQEQRPAVKERPQTSTKASRDKPREKDDEPTKDAAQAPADGSDPPKVADGGKDLPAEAKPADASDDAPPDPSLDPLLALGLGAQLPAPALDTPVQLGQAQLNAANSDGDLQKLNQAQGLNLLPGASDADASADATPQLQLQLNGSGKAEVDVKATDGKGEGNAKLDMASILAGLTGGQDAQAGKTAEASQQAAADLAAQLPENARETKVEARNDNFAQRLESLTQALNGTQQALTNRPVNPQVPGQAVAMQQNGWTDQVVDRVMWMSSQNLKSADIQMDPADLGRLEVRIHMTSDQTQVTFASANAGVREALDSQQQRLRDMLGQQGMNQVNVNVSDQSLARGWQGQGQQQGNGRGAGASGRDSGEDEPTLSGVSEIRARPQLGGLGMVDYYA
ncbi:flagellar hook-length control protein FliK [Pseudomonas citronellolis]|uniref:flagellar hook-length control protein FliK n=1 Tax=Pseudomonas citronellolis TaxID=53408 RepID=UPI0023E42ED9|nr:flagellar hook-length control protein FliK [Pseudomonas citronellolis]MDF3931418.1 flagellar hook-length control protein FliK [Pseudomonas citronellolis]